MLTRVFAFVALLAGVTSADPVKYILDTDLASDCDDAGAVALVNVLADRGEADVLAMMIATGRPPAEKVTQTLQSLMTAGRQSANK